MKKIGFFEGMKGFLHLLKTRKKAINDANSTLSEDPVAKQAQAMHPGPIRAKLISRTLEIKTATRLRFSLQQPLYFQPGALVSLRMRIGDSLVTRPYSIASSPKEGRDEKIFEIIARHHPDGFVSTYLCQDMPLGATVTVETATGPLCIDPIRDGNNIVAIAGGTGMGPFLSFAKWIHENPDLPMKMTIIHGSVDPEDIVGDAEIQTLNDPRIRLIPVISGPFEYSGEKGFIDESLLRRYSPEGPVTYFFCGPIAMEAPLRACLQAMGVDNRKIHCESFAELDVTLFPGYPQDAIGKTFQLHVHQGKKETVIPASSTESIAVALERAGLYVRTRCRIGRCGGCKVRLLEGNVYVIKELDSRRHTDAEYGYVHSCISYPLSDLAIRLSLPPKEEI